MFSNGRDVAVNVIAVIKEINLVKIVFFPQANMVSFTPFNSHPKKRGLLELNGVYFFWTNSVHKVYHIIRIKL